MYIFIVSSCKWYKAYVVTVTFSITIAAEKKKKQIVSSCRSLIR